MRLRSIPTDIAISASFVAVFLLAFIPSVVGFFLAPEVWLSIKDIRDKWKANVSARPAVGN
jgi:hypothetical protein